MRRLLVVLSFALFGGACSCAEDWGSKTDNRPCGAHSECLTGYSCVSGVCVAGAGADGSVAPTDGSVGPGPDASQPGDDTGVNPGDDTGVNPGDDTGVSPGDDAGVNPEDAGVNPGEDVGVNPGEDTGVNPGRDTGVSPGLDAGTKTFTVGGTVGGLAASDSVVLRNKNTDDLTVVANGTFTFATALPSGQTYAVTVFANPSSPISQTCKVTNGSGTVANANVSDVQVTCTTDSFTVGGTVAGLTSGNSLVLQDNGGGDLTVNANGGFAFAATVASGATYAVTVLTQPSAPPEACTVAGGTGTVGAANVASVTVTCSILGACVGKSAGFVCRAAAGQCDVAEACDGVSPNCPSDAFVTAGTGCRASAGICDVAESCTGSSADCPADGFRPSTSLCNPSAGICDIAEYCTGNAAACPANGFLPNSTLCRAALPGGCDVDEFCTGSGATCPADLVVPFGTLCRAASPGGCDVGESCDGVSNACPTDVVASAGTVCRAASGACDVQEACDGASKVCPVDKVATGGTVCRAAVPGGCDVQEVCDGSTKGCPADVVAGAGTVCRAAVAGGCDVQEVCTGSSNACPADVVRGAGTVCRAAVAGGCDVQEVCTGASNACPADVVANVGTVCRAAVNGGCDLLEVCNGTTNACPPDVVASAGTVCRAAVAGGCDVQEVCTGLSNACPADSVAGAGTVCRAAAGPCDVQEVCSGASNACPADSVAGAGTVCRSAVGPCDVQEVCNGSVKTCPADAIAIAGTVCRAAVSLCDVQEVCNGATTGCPNDAFAVAGTACRAAVGPCDAPEVCPGGSSVCPTDVYRPSSYVCNGGDACNLAAHCTGTTTPCPSTTFAPVNTFCSETYSSGWYYDWGCDGNGVCCDGTTCSILIYSYSSCPILYSWDGQSYAFESDQYTNGLLGLNIGGAYRKPDPNDAYVLRNALAVNEGSGVLEMRLVEELEEIDYLDRAQLFAVDVPAGRQVVAWANNTPGLAVPVEQRLVTVAQARQPLVSATNLTTGADVTAALAASDGTIVSLCEDNNIPYWNTIEIDPGDLTGASVVKLVVDARSHFPSTAAGQAARKVVDPMGLTTKLEVRDATGAWVAVPRDVATTVRPKEFPRAMVTDVTHIFLTNDYRMRLSWVYRTALDAIWIDTTPNEALTVTEAPLLAATLDYHGISYNSGGDFPVYTYERPSQTYRPPAPGSYTLYGDVSPLVGTTDDMFAIFGPGDELAFQFLPVASPAPGQQRFYAFASVGYYKQWNLVDGGKVPFTVEPLPFGAMSNFPYNPAVESYPTDRAHMDYLTQWNLRQVP